jgi:hypothetical protein
MKIRWTLVAVVATLFGLATPFAYADDGNGDDGSTVASLHGENFISQEIGQGSEVSESIVTGTCNLMGSSEFEFTITGEAVGAYSGTFTESGTLVTDPFGLETSFESMFTINSPAGTVEGFKSLVVSNLAICGSVAIGSGGPNAVWFEGTVSYVATITTPAGEREDSGTAFVSLQDFDVPPMEGFNGHSFSETFTSNDPGGGGGDDDDDDDGDDDDDDD